MADILVILALIIVIVIQALERYFFSDKLYEQVDKLTKALISKSSHDYTTMVAADKNASPKEPGSPDEEVLSADNPELFDAFIAEQNKA